MTTTTTLMADLVVRDPHGRLVALVEVKAGPPMTWEMASRSRDLVLGGNVSVPYFLLVSEEAAFLWALLQAGGEAPQATSCRMGEIIARYWPSRPVGSRITSDQLTFITRLWLLDLAEAFADELNDEASRCLAHEGLVEAMHGGTVLSEASA